MKAPPSRAHSNVAGSEAVNAKPAEVDVIVAGGPELSILSGGVVSGTTVSSTTTSSNNALGLL